MKKRRLSYAQFLPMWMRKNNIVVLFHSGELEAMAAWADYKKSGKIPEAAK